MARGLTGAAAVAVAGPVAVAIDQPRSHGAWLAAALQRVPTFQFLSTEMLLDS